MCLLGVLDFFFVSHAYHSILTRGASVQLVFGFEVKTGSGRQGGQVQWAKNPAAPHLLCTPLSTQLNFA